MNKVYLINLSPWSVGGFTSVTAHAYKCLREVGVDVELLRLNLDKTEKFNRKMSVDASIPYHNTSVKDALKKIKGVPTIVTGVAREKDLSDTDTIKKLIKADARVIVHGYKEHVQFEHIPYLKNAITIRKSILGMYDGVDDYLVQPYMCEKDLNIESNRRKKAVVIATIVKHKNPHIILEANRLIRAKRNRVDFKANEDRMFAKFTLQKKYPEYQLGKSWPAAISGAQICSHYDFAVDLTVFGKGNGGTQYCFMEAMDAGTVNIIHRDWLKDKGDMKEDKNCLAIETPKELAELLTKYSIDDFDHILQGGYAVLKHHGPRPFYNSLKKLF